LHARAVLRPDEGAPGTELEVTLLAENLLLFHGVTVLDPETGWPFEANLLVRPIATFELGGPWVVFEGNEIVLGDLSPIIYMDSVTTGADDIEWSSTDPLVVEIVEDRAVARSPGVAGVIGTWNGQVDTLSVEIQSFLALSPSELSYYLSPSENLIDTVLVEDRRGSGFSLDATVETGSPWLSASLGSVGSNRILETRIDGGAMPAGRSTGRVQVSSPGAEPAILEVEVDREPSSGVEIRHWSEFCLFGDSIGGWDGVTACIDLEVRAWTVGQTRRLVFEVRNLNGSLGDAPGTDVGFNLGRFGVRLPQTLGTTPTLLATRPTGPVEVVGDPTFSAHESRGDVFMNGAPFTSILGCRSGSHSGYITCDPSGWTGSVRFDLQIADASWSLTDALAIMRVGLPTVFTNDQLYFCVEGETGCHTR
jgi:hypothetical protein